MRVAVIGAGIAGLGCARVLATAGCEVTVFEKSRGVGGRVASRRLEGTVLDHGAPDLILHTPDGRALLAACGGNDVVAIVRPSGVLSAGKFQVGDDRSSVGYVAGLTQLAKRMAAPLDVRLGIRIAALRGSADGFELGDEQGNTNGSAQFVVISAPAPQAADLLEQSPEDNRRAERIRAVRFDPAVVVLVGIRIAEPDWWHATVQDSPLASISFETAKGREPIDGIVPIVARVGPGVSAELIDGSDEAALEIALPALTSALSIDASAVAWTQVKRWRYQAVSPGHGLAFEEANPPGTRIIVCGDWATTSPTGVAPAYASGLLAAQRVLSA